VNTAMASLPVIAEVDVCVVGAGASGSSAAIAAARGGSSVLLIDRLPFLGGTSTSVLDTFYGFFTPDRLRGDGAILELDGSGVAAA